MSLSMAATRALLRLTPKRTDSEAALRDALPNRRPPAEVPAAVHRVAHVEESIVDGQLVIRLSPREKWKRNGPEAHVIYTHGGAYVNPILTTHWRLLATLVSTGGVSITVPLYGLAPEHHVDEAYLLLDRLYDEAVEGYGERVFLAGDSAGGGLALGQAMRYRDSGRQAPRALILLSPWVDVTMSNPAIAGLAPLDPMLGAGGLKAAGTWWAGDTDPRSPEVSPLFGTFENLPPAYTYQGDRDLLVADAKLLTRRIAAAGGRTELRLYRGAIHVFVGAPWTPEARRALRHIASVLRG